MYALQHTNWDGNENRDSLLCAATVICSCDANQAWDSVSSNRKHACLGIFMTASIAALHNTDCGNCGNACTNEQPHPCTIRVYKFDLDAPEDKYNV